MASKSIGVVVESFRKGVKDGIKEAAAIGLDGVQVYVTSGEMDPENLDKTGREAFLDFVRSQGLVLSALCGDLGLGFVDAERNNQTIDKTKQMLNLCRDLQTPILTTHIGVIPEAETDPVWATMTEALEELGAYAENLDCCLATETGPESTVLMRQFLQSLRTTAVKVNYDPANLVMKGFDPIAGVADLSEYIVHTHAKDGLHPDNNGPKEVPLGEGDVNFPEYLKALASIGFDGFLTIERETGGDPAADVRKAHDFLRGLS